MRTLYLRRGHKFVFRAHVILISWPQNTKLWPQYSISWPLISVLWPQFSILWPLSSISCARYSYIVATIAFFFTMSCLGLRTLFTIIWKTQ